MQLTLESLKNGTLPQKMKTVSHEIAVIQLGKEGGTATLTFAGVTLYENIPVRIPENLFPSQALEAHFSKTAMELILLPKGRLLGGVKTIEA